MSIVSFPGEPRYRTPPDSRFESYWFAASCAVCMYSLPDKPFSTSSWPACDSPVATAIQLSS